MVRYPSKHTIFRIQQSICTLSRDAWLQGLFSATNGNVSIRLHAPYHNYILISATGKNKGRLKEQDLSLVHLETGLCLQGAPISSETAVHLSLYRETEGYAVLHTHPTHLLALECKNSFEALVQLPIFETEVMRTRYCQSLSSRKSGAG